MKRRKIQLGQYSFETKYLEGDTDEYLKTVAPLIGYIIYEFNSLEQLLISVLCQIFNSGTDANGLIILHKMSYSEKVDLFERLTVVEEIYSEKVNSIRKKLIGQLKDCGQLRNIVVHADWETVDKEGYAMVKVRIDKNGIQQEYVQFDEESLNRIYDLIIDTYNLFDSYDDERLNNLR